jgi:ABC-type transport system involved in multi-copper enzyme maturation permease subunit
MVVFTRSIVLVLVVAVVVAGLATVISHNAKLTAGLHTEIIVLTLFLLIATAIASAGEYTHKTIEWTLLGTPRRGSAAIAKLFKGAIIGLVLATVVLAVTWGVSAGTESKFRVGTAVGGVIAGQLILGALTGAFGIASGLALRNLPAAIAVVFTIALVLPLVFEAKHSLNQLVRFLPYGELSSAALSLGGSPAFYGPQLAGRAAGVVLLAWTLLIWIVALARFIRQDV